MRGIACWWMRGRSRSGRSPAPIRWANRTVSGVTASTRTAAVTNPHTARPSATRLWMASGKLMAIRMPDGSTRPASFLDGGGRAQLLVQGIAVGDRGHPLGQLGPVVLGRERRGDDLADLHEI